MIQRENGEKPVTVYGFLVDAELQEGVVTPEDIALKLADRLTFVEGVGNVSVNVMGKIDQYDESKV